MVVFWTAACASLHGAAVPVENPADYGPVRPDDMASEPASGGELANGSVGGGALSALADTVYGQSDTAGRGNPTEPALPVKVDESQSVDFQRERGLVMALRDRNLDVHASARGVVVILPDLMFEFGSAELTPEAKRKIQDISEVLEREGRGRSVAIEGHTDSIGAELFNQGLSDRRAARVARALEAAGIPDSLVSEKGYGSSFPIAPNSQPDGSDNPSGRARNRRVEIVILD